jgi:hypothetical protein
MVSIAKKLKLGDPGFGPDFWLPVKTRKSEPDVYNNNFFNIICIYIYIANGFSRLLMKFLNTYS